MNIIYFVFGYDISYYQQVFFSIYTALAHKEQADTIIVIAEDPTFFKQLDKRITVIPIDKKQIADWQGDYNYFFRVKIKALEFIAKEYPEQHILYVDGDTFIYKSLSRLKAELDRGQNFLHLNEGALPTLNTKTEKKLWRQIQNKTFAGIQINKNTCMWNSGVIGISKEHFGAIGLALQMTDEMCAAGVSCFTMEQLSFGLAANHFSTLQAADHVVGHYWGNKEQWNELISNWIKRASMKALTVDEMIEEAKQFPFKDVPYYLKYSNTHRRWLKKLQAIFKPKNPVYIKA